MTRRKMITHYARTNPRTSTLSNNQHCFHKFILAGFYMRQSWIFLVSILFMLSSMVGCIQESPIDYHYTVEDAEEDASIDSSDDHLFILTLGSESGVGMDISELSIVLRHDSMEYQCSLEGQGGNCTIVQTAGSDDSIWEIGEELLIQENGVEICDSSCIVTFVITGPDGSETTGPTVLTVR